MFRGNTTSNYNTARFRISGTKLPGPGAGECIVSGTGTYRARGLTIWELIVTVVLVAVVIVLAMAAISRWRRAPRSTNCLDNLRQLAAAANQYADDFNERFFYHWGDLTTKPDGTPGKVAGWWYDSERAGRYITNADRRAKVLPGYVKDKGPYGRLKELTGGIMVCPSFYEKDEDAPPRSYAMNFWASGIDPGVYLTKASSDPFLPPGHTKGELFRRNSLQQDRLLLFTEGILEPYADRPLVWQEDWYGLTLPPFYRFAGHRNAKGELLSEVDVGAFGKARSIQSWLVDYSRHTPPRPHGLAEPIGQVNMAFADGHVATLQSSDLYAPDRPTHKVLWSLIDPKVDEEYLNNDPSRGRRP